MKSNSIRFLCVTIVILAAGCVRSLNPLYSDEVIEFDPSLVGTWSDGSDYWRFEKEGDNAYKVTNGDDEEDDTPGVFKGVLVRLGEHRFLDLFPDAESIEGGNEFYQFHFLPSHTFMKIKGSETNLVMLLMDLDWLEEEFEKNPDEVPCVIIEDTPILAGESQALQAFVLKHAETPGAFGGKNPDETGLPRVQEPAGGEEAPD
jgi:hypothetical protein